MVQCRTVVKKNAVRRESIDGVEHVIVSSATLPDDIVMNGGLYPADEIAASFHTLERTLAPIEHPQVNGQFISANDPVAIHEFHGGAFNVNVRQENGRVIIEKHINVIEANKSERGKRLMDRIVELETSSDPRPIHTSVGVFVEVEPLDEPVTNAAGQEYSWVARNMFFDHDAILLDSAGAAQPHQGVGVAVNSEGKELKVQSTSIDGEPEGFTDAETRQADIAVSEYRAASNLKINELSFSEITDRLQAALELRFQDSNNPPDLWIRYDSVTADSFVYEQDNKLYKSSYEIDENENVRIQDDRTEVVRTVEYQPVNQPNDEDNAMRDEIIAELGRMGITVNAEITDAELQAKYKTALTANNSDDNAGIAEIVANAVKEATAPLAEQVSGLEAKLNSADETELNGLAELIGNSEKYPGLDAESAKKLGVETLKGMSASIPSAHGINPTINSGASVDDAMFAVNTGDA